MLEVLLAAFKDVSSVFGLILALSVGAGSAAMWLQQGALKEPGHDRDRLLRSLRLGGDLRRHYVFWVTRALNWIDRFLGDAGKAAQSLRVPFIRNRRRAPYWTGWSFDKCALLAVVYPFMGMFATWVWAGEAGEVGETLGLTKASPWVRIVALVMVLWMIFALARSRRATGWRSVLWLLAAVGAYAAVGAVAGAVAVVGAS